jgi:putative flippase GtrA
VNGTSCNALPKHVRFVLVGGLNTVFGYLVFAGLTRLGWRDVFSVPAAAAAAVAFNFMTYGKLVFESLNGRSLPRFLIGYVGLYACNVAGLRTLARMGIGAYVAQAALVVPLAIVSYVFNDRWVFRAK